MTHTTPPDAPPPVHYYTVLEIALKLRVTRMTVYRMIHDGRLVAHLVGRRSYRIPATEYDRYQRELDAEATARAVHPPVEIPGQTRIGDTGQHG